jgi:hypothetical protein
MSLPTRVASIPRTRRVTARAAQCLALLALLTLGAAWRSPAASPAPPGFEPLATQSAAAMIPPGPGRPKEFAFLRANGLFHIFYMRDNLLLPQDSTELELGHAVSTDLLHWTHLSPVLHVRPDKWDNGHIWAPHVVEQDGTYYMWYTGVTMVPFAWKWYQRIGVATSTDLMNWTRYDEPVYGGNMVPWAYSDSSQFDGCQFRDPYVMPDPDNPGKWLMYYVTVPAAVRGQLLVGIARNSGGMTPWHDLGEPMWSTNAYHNWGWVESPNVFQHGPLWYLFVTTNSGHVLGFRTATSPTADSTQWLVKYRLYDMVGQDPLSDSWFGVEHVNVNGRDYLAYVNPYDSGIDIQEMIWGTPPYFTLTRPITTGVPAAPPPAALGLAVLGRAADPGGIVLRLSVPAATTGRLELFDVTGRRVRELLDGPLRQGESLVSWDGRAGQGPRVPRGIYFARLVTPSGTCSARVLVTG